MNEQQLARCAELAALFTKAVLFVKHGGVPEESESWHMLVAAAEGEDPRLRDFANNLANNVYSMQFP